MAALRSLRPPASSLRPFGATHIACLAPATTLRTLAPATFGQSRLLCKGAHGTYMHEGDYFRQQERLALDKLKAAMAKKKKPIDEDDEKVRLSKILEKVGVREVIREELSVQLLLWKHDEDLVLAEQK